MGETLSSLRAVQARASGQRIDLRFVCDTAPSTAEADTLACVGAAVAADFPDVDVYEHAVTIAGSVTPPDWITVYSRA